MGKYKMLRLSFLLFGMLSTGLLANNKIQISATVQAKATTQTKLTYISDHTIQQDILIQTNHRGLTLSLSESSSLPSYAWLNNHRMGLSPLDFSEEIYAEPTKVAELMVAKTKGKVLNSIALIVSIK